MMTNEQVEDFVLARLPATYGQLCAALAATQGDFAYRAVDKALQRLRKRGAATFTRDGNRITWDAPHSPPRSKGKE